MSYVSQISGNEIVDNELRHALDKKVDEIRKQVEFLSVVSKAIGEMLICICSVIQSSDSFDEAKTIEKIFNKTTGVSASDGSYSKAYGNFASIILQLCGNTLPDNYRKGIPDGGTVPLTQTLIDNAKTVCQKIPTLGVCLGHQAICAAYGAKVTYAKKLMHGKQSTITFTGDSPLFSGVPEKAPVARYHSLAADPDTIPDCFEVSAVADDGEIMAVRHREFPIFGVQFHPESIMTPDGKTMLKNFIAL